MAAASSDDEDRLQVDLVGQDDETEIDPAICPICQGSTYSGDTIGCSSCPGWFHFPCVGVKHGDPEVENTDLPYYCPLCRGQSSSKSKKTSPSKRRKSASPSKRKRGRPSKSRTSSSTSTSTSTSANVSPKKSTKSSTPIKLKISFGFGEQAQTSTSVSNTVQKPRPRGRPPSTSAQKDSDNAEVEPSYSDEEEKWLDAVESGDVANMVDPELKSIQNPDFLTARQRAMISRGDGEDSSGLEEEGLFSFGLGATKKTVSTEEDEEEAKRAKEEKSQKRKEFELEKREQDKKKTVDKLLKKKDVQVVKQVKVTRTEKTTLPTVTYKQNANGFSISMPPGMVYPLEQKVAPPPPKKILCVRKGCNNVKNYTCSNTGAPLCSLECYKENIKESS